MEHLCVGSYVRIMTSCTIPANRKFEHFCEKIMLSLCPVDTKVFSYLSADGCEVTYSYTNFNKIHSSSQNLPTEVMQMALKKDAYAIERYFIQTIIPAMEEARKKNAVLALKNVILKDTTIADTTQLGTIGNITKNDLRRKNKFILSEFLTDMFIYAVAKTENMMEPEFTKSIKKDFYAAYNSMVDTIEFYEVTRPKTVAAIPLTSKGKFDKVFTPILSETLAISAKHDLQIFCLKFDDFDFDYHGLLRYLRNNIGYYVYSRAQIETYIEEDEISALAYDAVAYVKKTITDGKLPTGNELGELLLYIFLEQVLVAPKLMSKVEIGNYGGFITSKSSGIHLLTADEAVPFSQVIFGTSMINGDLQTAIDSVFAEAQKLRNRKKDERQFVDSSIFAASFPTEIYDQLEAIILPSEKSSQKPATAFGMFIGYSLNGVSTNGKPIDKYQHDVVEQIKNDIRNNVSFIESKIAQYGLDGYSVYVYLLPFADADKDKEDIMVKLLQSGGSQA